MYTSSNHRPAVGRSLPMAGVLAIAMTLGGTGAFAGQCPEGKSGTDLLKSGETQAQGVSDEVLSSIDVSKAPVNLKDRQFRLRRLEIQPGGVVPWHSHAVRPAIIYVVQGEITEYSSNCAVPIVHKAGEVSQESIGLSHWWKNTSDSVVILLSADLFPTKMENPKTM